MRCKTRCALLGLGMAATLPVALAAPAAADPQPERTVEALADKLRATGATGLDLVNLAIETVASSYTHDSAWHLWETPAASLRSGRGWSHQYNTVLLLVLRQLGFHARMVQAARVRGFPHPWWYVGHAWVKVTIDGRRYDACASRSSNRVGDVGFVPLTPEIRFRRVTRWAMGLGIAPFVVVAVWRAWLSGNPVPEWLYRRRSDG